MPKRKVQKDKQRSTKHTYKTEDRVTRTPLKTGDTLRCSGRVDSKSTQSIRLCYLLNTYDHHHKLGYSILKCENWNSSIYFAPHCMKSCLLHFSTENLLQWCTYWWNIINRLPMINDKSKSVDSNCKFLIYLRGIIFIENITIGVNIILLCCE